jgi:RHS repeat-associated protein
MNYDDTGNITSRSDVGTYTYGGNGAGPHAVTSLAGAVTKTCSYDSNGNRILDGANSVSYASFNKPALISRGGNSLQFSYGTDRSLYRQQIRQSGHHTTRDYVAGIYERETSDDGSIRQTHYIAGGSGAVAIYTQEFGGGNLTERTRYLLKDHLGSINAITDSEGAIVERQSFDAWGRRREVNFTAGAWTVSAPAQSSTNETHRGFTGHEMLDAVSLVHMNGRIYDPLTARFLSPDPFVQSPDNLQSLNRYAYVLNNPLSFTDPSGFFWKKFAKIIRAMVKPLQVAGAILSVFPATRPIGMILSSVASFGSAFSGTMLAGGGVGDALKAGMKAYFISSLTMALTSEIGGGELNPGARIAAHGVINGMARAAQGGEFKHGLFSGSFSAAFSPIAGGVDSLFGPIAGTLTSSLVGGTAERIGGGKFANGAVTGAMVHALNDIAHAANKAVESGSGSGKPRAFVGGFFDRTIGGPMHSAFEEAQRQGGNVRYFTWDDAERLADWIDANGEDGTVISHSYGADTAASVVANGHKINTLITNDPVSWFRPNFHDVAANSRNWVNFNAARGDLLNFSNIIAGFGGAWNNGPAGYASSHYEDHSMNHGDVHVP